MPPCIWCCTRGCCSAAAMDMARKSPIWWGTAQHPCRLTWRTWPQLYTVFAGNSDFQPGLQTTAQKLMQAELSSLQALISQTWVVPAPYCHRLSPAPAEFMVRCVPASAVTLQSNTGRQELHVYALFFSPFTPFKIKAGTVSLQNHNFVFRDISRPSHYCK